MHKEDLTDEILELWPLQSREWSSMYKQLLVSLTDIQVLKHSDD